MKKMYTTAAIAILILAFFAYLGHVSRSGSAAGLREGRLTPCPGAPNCVCSEDRADTAHLIEPLRLDATPSTQAMQNLALAVEQLGGRVVTANDGYVAATFSSSLFGFVDDVEFRLDEEAKLIHVRSASRVGHSDLGANRKRVEAIRSRLLDTPGATGD